MKSVQLDLWKAYEMKQREAKHIDLLMGKIDYVTDKAPFIEALFCDAIEFEVIERVEILCESPSTSIHLKPEFVKNQLAGIKNKQISSYLNLYLNKTK